jgi:catechol 2,3-dioxygenase-like lactoylglutathione lyase family enzyme
MSVVNVRHVGIVVSDMRTSLPFYRNLLGLDIWWDQIEEGALIEAVTGVKGAKIHTVKLRAPDGVSIELLQYLSNPRPVPALSGPDCVGCNHAALQVTDIEGLFKRAVAAGIEFNAPPQLTPDGKIKVTYCRDPEGVLLELVEVL